MKLPWRKKKDDGFTYQYLCRHCDFFFYKNFAPSYVECPNCGRRAELYDVYKSKEK